MNTHRQFLYAVCISFILYQIASGSGTLDPSFGSSGITISSVQRDDVAYYSLVQTDSQIVVVGSTSSAVITRAAIARYTVAGSLDTTFNTTGVQTTLVGSLTKALGADLQSDGKIVVTGYAVQSQTNIAVMRYNTDGSLDTTFNGVGFVTTSVCNGAMGKRVKVKSNGSIIVGGNAVNSSTQFMLAQYRSAGTLDILFGSSGIVTTSIGANAILQEIALQPDGKIVAAGHALDDNINQCALVRYNMNGSLDTAFGSSGIVLTSIGTDARIQSMKLQSDNKIVVAGCATVSGIKQFFVARYNTDGSLDTSFNASGMVLTNIQDFAEANALVIQTDGKLVVGGYSLGDVSQQFALARYTTTGLLDTSFGTNGITVSTIPTGSTNTVSAINALTVSSYILAVGFSDRDFALAAYTIL